MNDVALVELVSAATNSYDSDQPRSRQEQIGPSAIGFCRRHSVYTLMGEDRKDSKREGVEAWPADVGTAVHEYMDKVFSYYNDNLLELLRGDKVPQHVTFVTGSQTGRMTATLPNGDQITGTPDLYIPEWNMLVDIKTVNGLTKTKRDGVSQNHNWQRHLYALALVQDNRLQDDGTLKVANLYFDRSGAESMPYAIVDDYDPTVFHPIQEWVEDVKYARLHGVDTASQDIPAPVCERICEFFTVCRGGFLPDSDDGTMITDAESLDAVNMILEARELETEAKRLKNAAQIALKDVSGSTGTHQVRWTQVNKNGYTVEPSSYLRLDVRAIRKRG